MAKGKSEVLREDVAEEANRLPTCTPQLRIELLL